jgi:hypothetical protein
MGKKSITFFYIFSAILFVIVVSGCEYTDSTAGDPNHQLIYRDPIRFTYAQPAVPLTGNYVLAYMAQRSDPFNVSTDLSNQHFVEYSAGDFNYFSFSNLSPYMKFSATTPSEIPRIKVDMSSVTDGTSITVIIRARSLDSSMCGLNIETGGPVSGGYYRQSITANTSSQVKIDKASNIYTKCTTLTSFHVYRFIFSYEADKNIRVKLYLDETNDPDKNQLSNAYSDKAATYLVIGDNSTSKAFSVEYDYIFVIKGEYSPGTKSLADIAAETGLPLPPL